MNTNGKKKQPMEDAEGKFTKQDIWGLLVTFGMLLAAMLIRYAIYLPRFL